LGKASALSRMMMISETAETFGSRLTMEREARTLMARLFAAASVCVCLCVIRITFPFLKTEDWVKHGWLHQRRPFSLSLKQMSGNFLDVENSTPPQVLKRQCPVSERFDAIPGSNSSVCRLFAGFALSLSAILQLLIYFAGDEENSAARAF
jgi:hypothetical protein